MNCDTALRVSCALIVKRTERSMTERSVSERLYMRGDLVQQKSDTLRNKLV